MIYMKLLGFTALFVGVLVFLFDLYFVFISVGFCKKNCSKCKGYLQQVEQYKDIYVGGKGGRFYKHYLDYEYIYRVNGKDYHVSGGVPGTKGNLSQVVNIIYQRKKPKYAYIDKLTFPIQPIVSLLL